MASSCLVLPVAPVHQFPCVSPPDLRGIRLLVSLESGGCLFRSSCSCLVPGLPAAPKDTGHLPCCVCWATYDSPAISSLPPGLPPQEAGAGHAASLGSSEGILGGSFSLHTIPTPYPVPEVGQKPGERGIALATLEKQEAAKGLFQHELVGSWPGPSETAFAGRQGFGDRGDCLSPWCYGAWVDTSWLVRVRSPASEACVLMASLAPQEGRRENV